MAELFFPDIGQILVWRTGFDPDLAQSSGGWPTARGTSTLSPFQSFRSLPIGARKKAFPLLHRDHRLYKDRILDLQQSEPRQSRENGILSLSPETEAQLIWEESYRPEFGSQFPASILNTEVDWEDLVLPPHTDEQVKEILLWMLHGETLLKDWGMLKKLRPGLRVLFHGPPGTGKTSLCKALAQKLSIRFIDRYVVVYFENMT